MKIFISLPREYQEANQPPKPLDSEIIFELNPPFKCYSK